MQKRTFIKSLAAVTALSAIVLLTGCDEEKAVAEKPFRVGVTAGPHAAIVTEAAKVAAKNGLKVEVIEFTDSVTPDTTARLTPRSTSTSPSFSTSTSRRARSSPTWATPWCSRWASTPTR